jgi:hypothetical protein
MAGTVSGSNILKRLVYVVEIKKFDENGQVYRPKGELQQVFLIFKRLL